MGTQRLLSVLVLVVLACTAQARITKHAKDVKHHGHQDPSTPQPPLFYPAAVKGTPGAGPVGKSWLDLSHERSAQAHAARTAQESAAAAVNTAQTPPEPTRKLVAVTILTPNTPPPPVQFPYPFPLPEVPTGVEALKNPHYPSVDPNFGGHTEHDHNYYGANKPPTPEEIISEAAGETVVAPIPETLAEAVVAAENADSGAGAAAAPAEEEEIAAEGGAVPASEEAAAEEAIASGDGAEDQAVPEEGAVLANEAAEVPEEEAAAEEGSGPHLGQMNDLIAKAMHALRAHGGPGADQIIIVPNPSPKWAMQDNYTWPEIKEPNPAVGGVPAEGVLYPMENYTDAELRDRPTPVQLPYWPYLWHPQPVEDNFTYPEMRDSPKDEWQKWHAQSPLDDIDSETQRVVLNSTIVPEYKKMSLHVKPGMSIIDLLKAAHALEQWSGNHDSNEAEVQRRIDELRTQIDTARGQHVQWIEDQIRQLEQGQMEAQQAYESARTGPAVSYETPVVAEGEADITSEDATPTEYAPSWTHNKQMSPQEVSETIEALRGHLQGLRFKQMRRARTAAKKDSDDEESVASAQSQIDTLKSQIYQLARASESAAAVTSKNQQKAVAKTATAAKATVRQANSVQRLKKRLLEQSAQQRAADELFKVARVSSEIEKEGEPVAEESPKSSGTVEITRSEAERIARELDDSAAFVRRFLKK